MRPTVIGSGQRYRPSELLSEDVLGTLWRGTDLRTGSTLTVRLLDERLTTNPQAVHRATAQLRWAQWEASNPHLARVLDHNLRRLGERPLFVVSVGHGGETLTKRLERREALSVSWALRVIAAVADGLASAHAAWVYHGALTSASVLVDDDAVVKVTDVGLGELLEDRGEHARSARPTSLDERGIADVLAIAQLLGRLLSSIPGRGPAFGVDAARVRDDEVPEDVRALMRRALSPHRLQRPDMGEFATALAPFLAPRAPESRAPGVVPPAAAPRFERPERREALEEGRPIPAGRPSGVDRLRRPESDRPEPARRVGGTTGAPVPEPARPAAVAEAPDGSVASVGTPWVRRRPFRVGVATSLVLLGVAAGLVFALRSTDVAVEPRPEGATDTPAPTVTASIEPATVPVVLGLPVEAATDLLEKAGLVVGSVTTVPGQTGVVVRTEPTQGEAVTAGTAVDIFVGNGAKS